MSIQAPTSGAAVRLVDVGRCWGSTVALGSVSFTVVAGAFCVPLGPSGCGKTLACALWRGWT